MQKKNQVIGQFVGFAIVGISNTIVAYFVNVGVLWLLRGLGYRYDYVVANFVAFVLSVLWAYVWNNKYVFRTGQTEKRDFASTLIKTYTTYAFTGIILNSFLLWLWIEKLGVSKYIAPLINPAITLGINYLLSKFWVFKSIKHNYENGDKDEE